MEMNPLQFLAFPLPSFNHTASVLNFRIESMASSSSAPSIAEVHPPELPSEGFSPYNLATSLELLYCMKTDQIIPIQKINDVVIPVLLWNLSEVKRLLGASSIHEHGGGGRSSSSTTTTENDLSPVDALFEKVQKDLADMKETFERLKEWEDRLNTLTKSLMLYDWEGVFSTTERTILVEVLQTVLPDIDKMVSELKLHTSMPLEDSSAEASNSSPFRSSNFSVPGGGEISNLKWSPQFSETAFFMDFQARYYRLSLEKRKSLLCFSIFPEGSVIRKKVMTYLWIGEGFTDSIISGGEQDMTGEDIANGLFEELIAKDFIETEPAGDFNGNGFKINPLTRLALITLAQREDFFDFDSDGNPTVNFTRSGRACLVKTEEGSLQQLSTCENHEKLLLLLNVHESCLDFPIKWFSKIKNITVLHLGNWSSSSAEDNYIEAEDSRFLEGLKDARLLRCLSLNGISGITELPASICKLDNLRIMDLKACLNLEKLPDYIASLTKLTHLDMSGCYLIDSMPKGLASLLDLQVLKGFVIGGPGTEDQCTLGDLEKLEKLRKLSLYADRETTGEKGELSCLSKFKALRILTISWTAVPQESKPGKEAVTHKILKSVKRKDKRMEIKSTGSSSVTSPSLPASLEKVDLRCWPSSRMPSWMKPWELNGLKKLYISGGRLSDMQMIQQDQAQRDPQQWTAKILRLKFLKELKTDGQELRALFPSLVHLDTDCQALVLPI